MKEKQKPRSVFSAAREAEIALKRGQEILNKINYIAILKECGVDYFD
jgi:hypothetical protein